MSGEFLAARLGVVGPDEGDRGPFERQVRDAGVASRVHLVGPLYGREKFAALVDAAAFWLPSRQEGLKMEILEAMACERPVVISPACQFPGVDWGRAKVVAPVDEAAGAGRPPGALDDRRAVAGCRAPGVRHGR